MTMDEVITLASMIEKEAKKSDFAKVSAVFHNRLKADMTLGSDVTIKYATGSEKMVLGDSELSVNSAYNTYTRKGLPVGPICTRRWTRLSRRCIRTSSMWRRSICISARPTRLPANCISPRRWKSIMPLWRCIARCGRNTTGAADSINGGQDENNAFSARACGNMRGASNGAALRCRRPVYCGAKQYGLRAQAGNFDEKQLEQAVHAGACGGRSGQSDAQHFCL